MIEYVHLINFQKHVDKRIEFTDEVNYITGKNGEGKSATLRAIQWVALNKGNSKQFRRTYENKGSLSVSDETSVEIGIDGHVIKRVVSNTKNEYWLDGKKLTGFGRGVPTVLSALFGMSSINISEQFSPLFLVGESSGGTVAEELSKVANLDNMGLLVDAVNADIRKDDSSIDMLKDELDKVSQNTVYLRSYTPTIEKVYEDVNSIEDKRNTCYNCIKEVETIFNCLLSCKPTYDAKKVLNTVEAVYIPEKEDLSSIEEVVRYFDKHTSIDVDIPDIDIDFDRKDLGEIQSILDGLNKVEFLIKESKSSLDNVNDLLSDFKICPLCGNELKDCKHE